MEGVLVFVGNHRKYTDRHHRLYTQLLCGSSNSVVSAGVLPMVPEQKYRPPRRSGHFVSSNLLLLLFAYFDMLVLTHCKRSRPPNIHVVAY